MMRNLLWNLISIILAQSYVERMEIMSKSLFLMEEIGGNDYGYLFTQNRSFTKEIKPLVPKVTAKIENAIKVSTLSGLTYLWIKNHNRLLSYINHHFISF